jgi:pyruvate/2-oxoglutarate dehydrogenase complex dihydrolipoamide acyltransferase (E2) component
MTIINELIAPKSNADDTVLVRKLYFSDGDKVNKQDELLDLETSKTAIIIDSPLDGYVEYCVSSGDSVNVGEIIIRIHDSKKSVSKLKKSSKDQRMPNNVDYRGKIISNSALQFIDKHNIDISNIKTNFVSLQDIDKSSQIGKIESNIEDLENIPGTTITEVNLAKLSEIRALSSVQSGGIVSTIFMFIDIERPVKYSSPMFDGSDSLLPIIVFEASKLLKKYPILNAYFDKNIIRMYDDVNIGVAFDIDDGLKVYTIQNSDSLSLSEIELSISSGVDVYLDKKLTPEQLTGSTFTITDLSSFGVERLIPLVNYNQSSILGISSIDNKLHRANLSLSFDHRVTEGKTVSQFLFDLKSRVESHVNIYNTSTDSDASVKCDYCLKDLSEDKGMQGIGLIKIIKHDGSDGVICRTCLEGWM